ncbi:MAG: PLP-dependent aminotransferase family protein [Thermoprotei archaeon]|nr:PLP-dependent aminotransferase family protein [Thermoprotei archaeon]
MPVYEKFLAGRVSRLAASEVRELLKLTEGKDVISFGGGLPDPSTFMKEELAEIARDVILRFGDKALQYAPTKGVLVFRETLKGFLKARDVKVSGDDDVIVTTGSQEALYLASLTLMGARDVVIVEEPTYLAALNVFKFFKTRVIPVDVDDNGIKTDVLEGKLKSLKSEGVNVKLVYTIPTAQNPTGVTLSFERRKHLIELASQHDLLLLEDDPYGYFTFEVERPPPLKSMDSEGRVLYFGTFSKIMAPGFRLGWALGPSRLIDVMELAKQGVDLHSSTLSQYIAMEAIKRGVVDATIEKARHLYKAKRDIMLGELEDHMEDLAAWTKPLGGFFVFLTLKRAIDTKKLLPEAIERGVAYVPGQAFYVMKNGSNTMRLNYSYPTPDQIKTGIRRLASIIRDKVM